MHTYSKKIKKELSKLGGILHERELNIYLSNLSLHFEEWRKGNLSPFELSEKIHQYHQNPARELYIRYNTSSIHGYSSGSGGGQWSFEGIGNFF